MFDEVDEMRVVEVLHQSDLIFLCFEVGISRSVDFDGEEGGSFGGEVDSEWGREYDAWPPSPRRWWILY